jgi:hypothetical protein
LVFLALLLTIPLPLLLPQTPLPKLQQRPPPGLGSCALREILTWCWLLSLLVHSSM